jgi:hypothetical protein
MAKMMVKTSSSKRGGVHGWLPTYDEILYHKCQHDTHSALYWEEIPCYCKQAGGDRNAKCVFALSAEAYGYAAGAIIGTIAVYVAPLAGGRRRRESGLDKCENQDDSKCHEAVGTDPVVHSLAARQSVGAVELDAERDAHVRCEM